MARVKNRFTWKKVLALGLALLSVVGGVFGVKAIVDNVKEEKKTINPVFEVGALSEVGKFVESNKSIYTKESFEAKGLEVLLDFDSSIVYQVYWYDDLGEFAYKSEELSKSHKFYAPANHTARIEVSPVWDSTLEDEDKEIKWYNVLDYTKQLEIKISKNQELEKSDYKQYSLADTMWKKHEDEYFATGLGEYKEAPGVTSFEYTNTEGRFSSFYVEKYLLDNENCSIRVRLKDGTVYYAYASDEERGQPDSFIDDNMKLPTFKTAVNIPKDATIYVWGYFGEADLSETVFCFY